MTACTLTPRQQLCLTCQIVLGCRPRSPDCAYFAAGRSRRQIAKGMAKKAKQILDYLSSKPKATVKAIYTDLGLNRSTTKNHLTALYRGGQVTREKAPGTNGQHVYHYSLRKEPPCS